MSRSRIALVTDELAPRTPGGIGQLLAHLVAGAIQRDAGVAITIVAPAGSALDDAHLDSSWAGRVEVLHCDRPGSGRSPDHAQSLGIMRTLARAERAGRPFDVIEFPDFRGWAFATLEEKRLRRAFSSARVGVRVHGPASVIAWQEHTPIDPWDFDLERLALLHADVVATHVGATADAIATFFGFDEAWRARVRVEFPPLGAVSRTAPVRRVTRDLIFPTKVQSIKRPDLFVVAAARVMRRRPGWQGRAILAAARPSGEASAAIDALIPGDLAHRFLRHRGSQSERLALFAGNVVVVPSDFEAFSLAAWEAAQQGCPLVLSSRCPAFALGTPLGSSGATVHFDGTVDSLTRAMERALDLESPPHPAPPPVTPWWFDDHPQAAPSACNTPALSVLVLDHGNGSAVEVTLASLAAGSLVPHETLIGYRSGRAPPLATSGGSRSVELDLPEGFPEGAAWCELARSARGEALMAVRAGDRVDPDWIEQAMAALASPHVQAITPSVDGAALLGGATTAGLLAPVVAAPGSVWRRRTWSDAREDSPSLESLCWALGLDCALAGQSIVASQEVGVRAGSPLKADLDWLYRRLPVPLPGAVHPLVLMATRGAQPPLRHRVADALETRFRSALPGVHDLLRRQARRLFRRT